MVVLAPLLALLAAVSPLFVLAHPAHTHPSLTLSAPSSNGKWYHDDDHPVNALFRRHGKRQADPSASSSPSPSVGSDSWSAQYPESTPDTSMLPQAWVDALNAAVSAGKIPDIPQSTTSNGDSPVYPGDVNADRNNATVCAATDRECRIPGNIWDAPNGTMGIGFDDGPTPASPALYTFLQQQNQQSTHYMIGLNILNNWQEFLQAYDTLKSDIAVHTYTHPYMTTLSNMQLLAEFGWTIKIIHDSTGGKIPRFWRPPYGDIDTRVSAVALEVFGLTAVLWNQDTEDWSIGEAGGTTSAKVEANMQKWLSGPKSPGLIILEHELTNDTVQCFINAWPLVAQNGWEAISQTELNSSMPVYQDGEESDAAFSSDFAGASTTTSASASSESGSASGSGPGLEIKSASGSGSVPVASSSAQGETSSAVPAFVRPFMRPPLAALGLLVAGALVFV